MTSWVVVDSGIVLSTVLPLEPSSDKAESLLQHWVDSGVLMAAPVLFRYETAAVVRKHVHRGTLSLEDGIRARETLMEWSVQLMVSDELIWRGYDLATRFNRPTAYDAQYLAVAEHLNCEFWTADQRLYNAVSHELAWVKWVGNFTPPPVSPNE